MKKASWLGFHSVFCVVGLFSVIGLVQRLYPPHEHGSGFLLVVFGVIGS